MPINADTETKRKLMTTEMMSEFETSTSSICNASVKRRIATNIPESLQAPQMGKICQICKNFPPPKIKL